MGTARITITISRAGMCATADVSIGDESTVSDLWQEISAAGVQSGIDETACRELGDNLADETFTCDDLVIATGDPGQPGRDGEVELELGDAAKRQNRADGSLDHRERSTLHTATQGSLVARYKNATSGTNGATVTGEVIEQPAGKECLPNFGPGVEYKNNNDDGEITALIPGLICFVPGKSIDVTDLCVNPGNVDYESGNLRVDSSLQIKGNVLANFQVTAVGNVIIEGQYCSGTVYSESNIHVAGGITGGDQAKALEGPSDIVVCAAGNITCRHANGATLAAGATVSFGDHCVNSWVTAKDVELLEGRGKVVGGELQATHSIKVNEAGSPSEQRTMLAIGSGPEQDERLSDAEKLAALAAAEIVVTGIAHPGVVIRFGRFHYTVTIPVQSVRFTFDEAEEAVRMQVKELDAVS